MGQRLYKLGKILPSNFLIETSCAYDFHRVEVDGKRLF